MCFVGELGGRAVAFLAALQPGMTVAWIMARNQSDKAKALAKEMGFPVEWLARHLMREHRTVVAPEFQGLGLGSLMADMVAYLFEEMDIVFMSTTAHPTYGGYRDRFPLWVALPSSQKATGKCPKFSHVGRGSAQTGGTKDPEREQRLRSRVGIEGSLVASIPDEPLAPPKDETVASPKDEPMAPPT